MTTNGACFRITGPKIVHEEFEDEVLIVNLETGAYYSARSLAAEIWTRISVETTKEIVNDLHGRYGHGEHDVRLSVMRYFEELQREGLIVPAETLPERSAEAAKAQSYVRRGDGVFRAPVLNKFDDMKELLLLDPIHDFDDTGWPVVKTAEPPKD
jgi:hypothetical protein